ncbi:hypothetical protein HWV62_23102 [Athelia sp. TMB]|nr:hypothetical protein HWV62_23102 [Athelia sp. TMB]
MDKLETATSITFSLSLIPQNTGGASEDQNQRADALAQSPQTFDRSTTGAIAIPLTIVPADNTTTPRLSINPAHPDISQLQRNEALSSAQDGINRIQPAPPAIEMFGQAISISSDATNALGSFAATWGTLLQKIELFIEVADRLSEVIIAQRDRDESLCDLMNTIKDVHLFMIEANPLKIVASQRKILENMGRLTVESAYLIRDFTIDKAFWKQIATLTLSGVEAKIKQYDAQFKQLKTAFQERAVVNIEITAFRCLVQVEEIVLSSVTKAHPPAAKDISFQDMAYAKGAGYDLDKCCLPGTRSDILAEIHRWINFPDEDGTPRVMVLAGVAGCGKTAIANSIARHYDRMKRLGSSVFFERADQAQRHCGNLLSTMARDIANLDAQWRSALYEVIKGNDSLRQTKSVSRQWESFILEPARSLNTIGPIVIVIDALDESGDVAARRGLLQSLAKKATELPANFRILVTTRAEDDIWRAFVDKQHIQLKIMDLTDHQAIDEDISKFIETQLAEISDVLEKKMPNKQWCYGLVRASDHLFQWAATACLAILLRQGGYTPEEITADLTSNKRNLDGLYTSILAREFKEHDELVMGRFRRVMGNILAANEPLSMQSHRALWRQCDEEDIVGSIVGPLGSLLSGSKDTNIAVSALHTSFFDFLKDRQRSGAYYVDPTKQNQHLALASLRVMKAELKFNICGLESSQKPNIAMTDLAARIQRSISSVLSYSCRFLGTHVALTAHDAQAHNELREFLFERFIYWLEVLSLEQHVNTASKSLSSILTWTQRHSPDLADFVKDAIKFVNAFAPAISESAPHIYLSVLPFAPKDSLISKQYSWKYPGVLRLQSGSLDSWPSALKTIEGHKGPITSVDYSPDGKHIVSGAWDDTIWVWDAETGEIAVGPITGHSSTIISVKYSPDGRHIVSGSWDESIRVWDALTCGMVAGPFEGHTRTINAVAWSPDGRHVVSGSDDMTCRVWDIKTGGTAAWRSFEEHGSPVKTVVYSPDGKHIACGLSDGTIRVLDAETSDVIGVWFEGHAEMVTSIAYSPDGKCIVSGSYDKTVRVWDVATGEPVAEPFKGHVRAIRSVAYSSDGKFIASGSDDRTVRVSDAQTGVTMAGPFEGHSGAVNSVAFSPDGRCIVSGAEDKTLRVWHTESTGVAVRAVEEGRGGPVLAVVYSSDGRHVASGSVDGNIRIWNAEIGKLVLRPLEGHSDEVSSVVYSPDGNHLVSGSYDGTLRIWSIETGTIVAGPFQGHASWVMAVAWSPDGKHIVSGSDDSTIRVWDVTTGETTLGPLTRHKYRVTSVAYSPDGKHIVSGSWDKTIRIWNIQTGKMAAGPFRGHSDHVLSVTYSPDGQRVASGSRDKTIRVWDVHHGVTIAGPFQGHGSRVNSVVYSPDARYIISCSYDKTIRIWDVDTGEIIAGLFAHSESVNSVVYSRDGKHAVSGSVDSTTRIWNVEQALVAAKANLRYVMAVKVPILVLTSQASGEAPMPLVLLIIASSTTAGSRRRLATSFFGFRRGTVRAYYGPAILRSQRQIPRGSICHSSCMESGGRDVGFKDSVI